MIQLKYISTDTANKISGCLEEVIPSVNRILVLSPSDEEVTSSGIIIPGNIKEGKPRKGVIIKSGPIDDDHKIMSGLIHTGMIITYGLYAGKEVDFDRTRFDESIREQIKSSTFTVLDLNEIVMSEFNH